MASLQPILADAVLDPVESRLFRNIIRGVMPAFERARLDLARYSRSSKGAGDEALLSGLISKLSSWFLEGGSASSRPLVFASSERVEEHLQKVQKQVAQTLMPEELLRQHQEQEEIRMLLSDLTCGATPQQTTYCDLLTRKLRGEDTPAFEYQTERPESKQVRETIEKR